MTYNEALEYIHSISWTGSRPGLERIGELCSLLGDPQDQLKFVHVAGTNGKGSFCSMLTQMLIAEGKKVGTFTSPFVFRFNERMCVNGDPIPDNELAKVVEYVKPFADSMADAPTEFELITAVAFVWFLQQNCDIVVLEAGMGGRLDSTNIIKTPLVSVITGIALDHTDFLGDTKPKIAAEKAGIIKKGVPVITGTLEEDCLCVIEQKAKELLAPITTVKSERLKDISLGLLGSVFSIEGYEHPFSCSLAGEYQPRNALLTVGCAELLGISKTTIYEGIKNARWRARFEVVSKDPLVIYDGGHNPQGAKAAIDTAEQLFDKKINILTGVMADKDYNYIAGQISRVAKRVFCVTPNNPRALDACKYAEAFTSIGVTAKGFQSLEEGVSAAYKASKEDQTPLLALGSLYMYADFINELNKAGSTRRQN